MSISAVQRLTSLRQLINAASASKRPVRVMEAHSGLSALIGEKARAKDPTTGEERKFDALWSSSLTSSTVRAKPDIEVVDTTQRLQIVEEMLEASTLPVVYDGDTGGHDAEIFKYTVQKLQRLGVSCCIIEDKTGLKQNSLFGNEGTRAKQVLADPEEFAVKLKTGQDAKLHDEFMVVARLESLIAGYGVQDALDRAKIYIEKGHVDGIMIHSKEKAADEVLEVLAKLEGVKGHGGKDLVKVVVPTTYNTISEDELGQAGVHVVIHANHLLRASYPAMMDVAESILASGRSHEVEKDDKVMSVKKIISMF